MAPDPPPRPSMGGGLPAQLKSGIEALSGVSMDGVRVHRNSSRPATVQARAYAQGKDIHLAPGQDHQLPHEAWHVVQQAKGRVRATGSLTGGTPVNDDPSLEREADVMGARAMRSRSTTPAAGAAAPIQAASVPIQRRAGLEFETSVEARVTQDYDPQVNANSGWVTQDETMARGAGWQVDSDNSKLEFVTDPPVDIGPLAGVAKTMFDHVEHLPRRLRQNKDLAAILGVGTTKPYTVLAYPKREITGAPQGTIGIPFDKLYSFFDLLTRYQMQASDLRIGENQKKLNLAWKKWKEMPSGGSKKAKRKAARKQKLIEYGQALKKDTEQHGPIRPSDLPKFEKVASAVDEVAGAVQNLAGAELAKLKGLLHFIGQYVTYASTAGNSYEKKRFPVMARSSFNSMYAALNGVAKDAFIEAAKAVVAKLGYETTTVLLPGRENVSFDVQAWLNSIKTPVVTVVPETQPREMTTDLMTAPGAGQGGAYNTDKSMGSLTLDNGLVVVELRQFRLGTSSNSFTIAAARKLVDDLKALLEKA